MEISIYKESNFYEWNNYVNSDDKGEFYHLAQWMSIIQKHYRCKNLSLLAKENNKITGVLPLFLIHSIIFGKVLVTNPFAGYCGICSQNGYVKELLKEKAIGLAKEFDVNYLEFREHEVIDVSLDIVEEHCTQSLRLDSTADRQFKAFSDKKRNIIRKALSKNMEIEFSNRNTDGFYRIYSHSIKEAGGFAYSHAFFKDVLAVFHEYVEVATAKYGKKTVAVRIDFYFRNILYSVWAAGLRSHRSLSAGDLLVWETMKRCISRGISDFNFGRSQYGSGIYQYKKWWGAETTALYYHYYTRPGGKLPSVKSSKNKYRIPLSLWKKAPVFLTNYLGPKLIRNIPL